MTHVLDTSSGLPAPGVKVEVHYQESKGAASDEWTFLSETVTNNDGRTDEPVIGQEKFEEINTGKTIHYKLTFHVQEYYGANAEVFFHDRSWFSRFARTKFQNIS